MYLFFPSSFFWYIFVYPLNRKRIDKCLLLFGLRFLLYFEYLFFEGFYILHNGLFE